MGCRFRIDTQAAAPSGALRLSSSPAHAVLEPFLGAHRQERELGRPQSGGLGPLEGHRLGNSASKVCSLVVVCMLTFFVTVAEARHKSHPPEARLGSDPIDVLRENAMNYIGLRVIASIDGAKRIEGGVTSDYRMEFDRFPRSWGLS